MSKLPQYPQPDRKLETDLVERFRAGDQAAFAEIYSMYFPRVFAFCLRRIGERSEAEDVAQETFVQLYRSLGNFEGRSSLLTWTFGIAHNVCSRYFRHCSRWMIGHRDASEVEEHPIDATTERRIDAARTLARCEEVLTSARKSDHHEIFRLRYAERLPIRSIAERVGKSNEAVKVSLRRSRVAISNGVPELASVLDTVAQSA